MKKWKNINGETLRTVGTILQHTVKIRIMFEARSKLVYGDDSIFIADCKDYILDAVEDYINAVCD